MKYKAIIFDMDGTIIDTGHIWKTATNQIVERRGVVVTQELEAELTHILSGRGLHDSCSILKEMFNLPEDVSFLVKEKTATACALYEDRVLFIDGFVNFIKQVQAHNLPVGVATNADNETLSITVKTLNLSQYFGNHIYNVSHVDYKYKPDPAIYLHASRQLGINAEECIAIEDSACGIKAAKSAGMFCIGLNTSKDPLQIQESHLSVDSYDQIDLKRLLGL